MFEERVQLKPLNAEGIALAQNLIRREHPLSDAPITVTLPFMRPVKRWFPCCFAKEEAIDPEEFVEGVFEDIADLAKEALLETKTAPPT